MISTIHSQTSELEKSLSEHLVTRFDMQTPSFFGNGLFRSMRDFQVIKLN